LSSQGGSRAPTRSAVRGNQVSSIAPFDLDQGAGPRERCDWRWKSHSREDTMLAPNPKAELLVDHTEDLKPVSSPFQKILFVGVLVVAYTIAAAALAYPVLMYVWW
jgi:hypothetical protein